MTKKPRDLALIARSVALNVGRDAYQASIDRMDNREALYALEAVRTARTGLDVIARQAVLMARQDGETWQEIANSLGLNSRQAAEARYGDL
jgi:hypothetical protein